MGLVRRLRMLLDTYKDRKRYLSYIKSGNLFHDTCSFGRGSSLLRSFFGKDSGCNSNCQINDSWIGNYVNIACNVIIGPRGHLHTNFTTHDFVYTNNEHAYTNETNGFFVTPNGKFINKIGHDVWIGCNVVVLPGVEIGNGAVVAAGSIVTKSVPPYAIIGGNPAKFIKWRFNKEQRTKIEQSKWFYMEKCDILEMGGYRLL